MSTTKNTGVRNHTPNVAVSPAGSEVTAPPSAAVPAGTPSSGAVSAAIQAFELATSVAISTLESALDTVPPGSVLHLAKVSPARERVISMTIDLLRKHPTLSGAFTADNIDTEATDADTCVSMASSLEGLHAKLIYSARVRQNEVWHKVSEVYAVAEKRALTDSTVARDFAAIQAILVIGPRRKTSAHTAVDAAQRATTASARATKAQKTAADKAAKAAALLHGTGDVVIVPASPTVPDTPPGTPAGNPPKG